MSDETPGVGQGAPPPREGQGPRPVVERPAAATAAGATMRLAHVVGGQYVLTTQSHGMPSLTQINPGNLSANTNLSPTGITRIISISPSRVNQTNPLRPSLANQSIVNVLTKPRTNTNVRLQLFSPSDSSASNVQHPVHHRTVKRPLSTPVEKKDSYASKLQHVMNHRIVRSKLVKEKYNEHLLEAYYLETGNNILDLYQFAKRPKTQAYLAYLKEHAVDSMAVPQTTPSTPSATSASSLPGISHSASVQTSTPTVSASESGSVAVPKPVSVKTKTPVSSTVSSQELIVEKAKQEAYVVQRVADLQKEGLWSEKRLPKVQEMHRAKAHWDFLLEEMVWLAADFAQERKWKKAAAKKCARMVQKYFQDKALAAQKAEKAQEQNLRRIASFCAKEVKIFWGNVEKLVEFKQNTILEEKRKKALDQQLSFIVDQTEKYSQLLAEGMNKTTDLPASTVSSRSASRAQSDTEFHPDLHSDDDDEETIEQEEAEGNDGHKEEVEALRKESQMELDDLLEDDFLRDYLLNRDKIRLSESEDSDEEEVSKKPESKRESVAEDQAISEAEDSDVKEEEEDSEGESEEEARKMEVTSRDDHDELKLLVEDSHKEGEEKKTEKDDKDKIIDDAAAIAESIQPKGNTLSSTNVSTNIPFLLKFSLREYQHIGLDWLVTMYDRKLNGILADEMGLGKTIQTIALLAHLACEKEDWGPHLIVVPTSVMLNWEMECKKWCPAFKILTYYGSQKERKLKRTGWTKPNAFHICITSYKLVIQDHQSFRRKKWKYLILDEAQNIKNFKSQRWQLLLNFQTQQRLLLTGTPLQNNLMELWSLMHFLMPNVFQSHREFKEWFSNPVTGMIEGNSEYNENIIKRLHKVLRPFLLRRLKSEVEKQMPKKYEHVVVCRLSKRQRYLYDDYMSRAKTRETLASGNMLSVINVLMQLRKVCNHPNLFEVRPTISPFQCEGISLHIPSVVYSALDYDPDKHVNLDALNLLLIMHEIHFGSYQSYRMRQSRHSRKIIEWKRSAPERPPCPPCKLSMRVLPIKGTAPVAAGQGNAEKKETNAAVQPPPLQFKGLTPQNVKVKVAGMQLLNQQGILKTIPVVNISQGATGQIGSPVNVTSLLKPADKISASFAQLVQTSTGKHLLLTSNPNITANIPVSSTPGGQKLTFLSKQPVSTVGGNTGHAVTKAFVKFQLTSVTTATTVSTVTTNSSTVSVVKSEDKTKASRPQISNDFIGRLYSKQNSLDVRWQNEDKNDSVSNEEDPSGELKNRLILMANINKRRCSALPLYGRDFQDAVKIFSPNKTNPWDGGTIHCLNTLYNKIVETTSCLRDMLYSPERRIETLKDVCDRFIFYVPAVKSTEPSLRVWHPPPSKYWGEQEQQLLLRRLFSKPSTPLHHIASATVTQFPDPRLIQYDCGKLQTLDRLLRELKTAGHRVLIFTQMTKMLDVLEAFLNFHGHIYLRLDGTTKVDQRQVLMERFNGDKRIFAFILSTRSGGVGVNLTGADTVIFYDSDWNPTMDAQAQDRCHRIGQTRDVHIYRLVSERTIEENILKKANQKRLLGDLAIEGGNFTTAFFKSSTIQDLFDVDEREDKTSDATETKSNKDKSLSGGEAFVSASDEKSAMGALENALAACEDDQDVQAAKIAKAEAVADLAEFDENIPLDEQEAREPEVSKAEVEINNIIEKLSPIEKYAMKFIETTESAWSAEQLAAAEREIEQQKREWEENRLAAMREEEERRARELEEDGDIITFSREDATNQIWVSDNTSEHMPMWCPPTPPQQENDIYIDQTMAFLYDTNVMSETDLPPVYVKREVKRSRQESASVESRRALKIPRKEESVSAPKSLFHSASILKMRRDMKLQKYRGVRPSVPLPGKSNVQKQAVEQPILYDWTLHEDMALLKVVQHFQSLPVNLATSNAGHTPNWDLIAEFVNTICVRQRSPKQCRQRYEAHLMLREEGKQMNLEGYLRKKKTKAGAVQKYPLPVKANRSVRASQDGNAALPHVIADRVDHLRGVANKKTPATRTVANNPLINKTKNAPVSNECGIDLEHPVLPVEVAARRAERLAKEKKNLTPEQKQFAARLHLMKGIIANQQQQAHSAAGSSGGVTNVNAVAAAASSSCQIITQTTCVVTAASASVSTPVPSPNTLRTQRIIASPIQPTSMVSVSGLSPAQLQAATQRLIVSTGGAGLQGKTVMAATASGVAGKTISPSQFAMLRQANLKQQLRLHAANVKTSTLTIGGQQAVVQFTQAQPRAQFVRQGVAGLGGAAKRSVTESEMAQLLKKQQQLQQQQQQQKLLGASATAIQGLSPQVLAQAMQAGGSGTTLVKTVSSAGVTQTVSIPVTGVALSAQGKTLTPTLKTTGANQLRQLQLQQQLLAQKKLNAQKLSIAQVSAGKSNVQTQLIVGSKPLSTAMTVQQFQQVIRSPLNVSQGPVVLAKAPQQRVIPVNTSQGGKQTIQVVAATSQLNTTLRPQSTSTLAGALAGIKVQGTGTGQTTLLSQVSAALSQNVGMRQGSPVRIQTSNGTPIVAVSVQSVQQQQQQQQGASPQSSSSGSDHVSRFLKK